MEGKSLYAACSLRSLGRDPFVTGLTSRQGDAISGKNEAAMNYLVTLGFVVLLVALVVALDGDLALITIDRLVQSEGYTDIQNVMTVTNAPIRF